MRAFQRSTAPQFELVLVRFAHAFLRFQQHTGFVRILFVVSNNNFPWLARTTPPFPSLSGIPSSS
jgi:hypothetical protein